MQSDQAQEQNLNINWLVLDTIRRMRDVKAEGNKEKYFSYCDFGLKLVHSYFPLEIRKALDSDYRLLRDEIKKVKEQEQNDTSRKRKVDELNAEFAELHDGRLMSALARMGIIKNIEDGIIDVEQLGMDKYAQIVQDRRKGVIKAVEQAQGGKDELPPK